MYPTNFRSYSLITRKTCQAPITQWCCAVSQKQGDLRCTTAKNWFT